MRDQVLPCENSSAGAGIKTIKSNKNRAAAQLLKSLRTTMTEACEPEQPSDHAQEEEQVDNDNANVDMVVIDSSTRPSSTNPDAAHGLNVPEVDGSAQPEPETAASATSEAESVEKNNDTSANEIKGTTLDNLYVTSLLTESRCE